MQDAMTIHTRYTEKQASSPLPQHSYPRDVGDEREKQETTVKNLGITIKDGRDIKKELGSDNHQDQIDSSCFVSSFNAISPPHSSVGSTVSAYRTPSSSSPPSHSFIGSQVQHQSTTTLTETQAIIDDMDTDPCVSAASSLLLLPTNQPHLQGSKGLDLWHTWLARSSKNGTINNFQISPQLFLKYLDSVLIPKEQTSSPSALKESDSGSLIQNYIRPIILLWQQQQQQQPQQQQSQTQKYPSNFEQPQTTSLTSHTDITSIDNETTNQKLDQDQRFSHLEKLLMDTALNISQLKEHVQHLAHHKGEPSKGRSITQPQSHQHFGNGNTPPKQSNTLVPQLENGDRSNDQSSAVPQQVQRRGQQEGEGDEDVVISSPQAPQAPPPPQAKSPLDRNFFKNNCHSREDEFIALITRGLEIYHGRSSNSHPHPSHYQTHEPSAWRHDDECNREQRNNWQHPRRPMSTSPEAVTYHNRNTVEPSDQDQPSHHDIPNYDNYPDQRSTFPQEDYLVPGVPGQLERSNRSRKRSSSVNGPGTLVKENAKQARSCSPLRPRTSSGATTIEGTVPSSPRNGVSVVSSIHSLSQSQPSLSNLVSQRNPSYPSRSVSDQLADPQEMSKDSSSTPTDYNGTAEYYIPHEQHNYQYQSRGSHSHKYSYASQISRAGPYADEEYPSYYRQNQSYQHSEEQSTVSPYSTFEHEQNYPAYFQNPSGQPYRGKHTKNQASLSSHYSTSQAQHQYRRNDSRLYNGYEHQHLNGYLDHHEEDVKPYHYSQNSKRLDPGNPIYVMNRQVNTVPELWKEWTVGLGPGNPSIRQLEAQYGPSWRTSSSAANFFSRRLRIINEIQRMIDFEGLSEEEAVNRLEARREQGVVVPGTEGILGVDGQPAQTGGMSLHRLSEILRKKQL